MHWPFGHGGGHGRLKEVAHGGMALGRPGARLQDREGTQAVPSMDHLHEWAMLHVAA